MQLLGLKLIVALAPTAVNIQNNTEDQRKNKHFVCDSGVWCVRTHTAAAATEQQIICHTVALLFTYRFNLLGVGNKSWTQPHLPSIQNYILRNVNEWRWCWWRTMKNHGQTSRDINTKPQCQFSTLWTRARSLALKIWLIFANLFYHRNFPLSREASQNTFSRDVYLCLLLLCQCLISTTVAPRQIHHHHHLDSIFGWWRIFGSHLPSNTVAMLLLSSNHGQPFINISYARSFLILGSFNSKQHFIYLS